MNVNRHIIALCALAGSIMAAKAADDVSAAFHVERHDADMRGTAVASKPAAMWIDTEANFDRLATKANIDAELERIKSYGMNMVYVDAKASNGYALYKSDFLPYCNQFGPLTAERDYDDYLGYIIEKSRELGLDVVASVCVTGWGYQDRNGLKQGYVFDHFDEWKDKVQVRNDNDDPSLTVPITDDLSQSLVTLDPIYPEVQDLVLRTCRELVTRYPGLKGISLDYPRYNNNDGGWYGMSDDNMKGYARYWNEAVPSRHEIVTETGGVGPKFSKWIEYRSSVITDMLAKIRKEVKTASPECEIHLWASAEWSSRFSVGQNWASKKYKPQGYAYTDTYSRTGFADLLDVFVTGAYTENVWNADAPGSQWTVENFCSTYKDYIMGDCRCYGSIAAYALDPSQIADATYICLTETDGYMTFELSHVNNPRHGDRWQGTIDGIIAAEKSNKTK